MQGDEAISTGVRLGVGEAARGAGEEGVVVGHGEGVDVPAPSRIPRTATSRPSSVRSRSPARSSPAGSQRRPLAAGL